MHSSPNESYARRILQQLLRMRAGNALPVVETAPGRNIWRYVFRAAGQPVSVDLDVTVSTLRVYHARDEVAMSPVAPQLMDVLVGRIPVPAGTPASTEAEALPELRKTVAEWREGNPRIYMRPPVKVGHPDNWNHA